MVGTRLGHYAITSHLGSGGMGEVYQAADSKLGRSVAIKVLPEAFSHDTDRAARFEREARVLASLNHSNIAAIYGFEEYNGRHFLVMELVPGETLEERIDRGAIPLHEVLPLAKQIAEALEEAHEAGVVHRDLKPANIKITGRDLVKVLDFGLAKSNALEPVDVSLSHSPTLAMSATNAGVILGTAAYMAPEQARGRPVDRRADIWAFGVVLFRMLTGGRMFEGDTVTETLAKVIEREPEWDKLPANTPPSLRKLLQRCLVKNPKNRLQAIGDARIVLQELIDKPDEAPALTPNTRAVRYPPWKKALPWAAAVVFFAGGFLLKPSVAPADRPLLQFDFPLPEGRLFVHGDRPALDVSPDGRRVAYVGAGQQGRSIYVRNLEGATDTAIAGTDGALNVFFSPDGNSLGYQVGLQVRKVALTGATPPVVVVDNLLAPGAPWGPPGITWGPNGMIVYPNNLGSGLSMVRDTGGKPEEFTALDPAAHEVSHRLPHFLPDGSGVLFTVLRYSVVPPDWSRAQVWVKSLKSGERKLLIDNALDARSAGDNALVFARQGKLFAVRFDPASLSVSGPELQVLDGVVHSLYGQGGITWSGAAQVNIASTGSLFFAPGSFEPPNLATLVWFDRAGKATPVTGMRDMYRFGARLLPDGVRIASSEVYEHKDIWIFDSARGIEDRATFEGQNAFPIWAPNGSRFAFRSDRAGPQQIYLSDVNNMRNVKPLTAGPFDVPSAWTPDAKELLFTRGATSLGGNTDIYAVSIDAPDTPRPVVSTPADERFPELSPDGKWLAYVSDETGTATLYVQPYPGPGLRVTVASRAQEPAWSKNSNELFYRGPAGPGQAPSMVAMPFTVTAGSFVPGTPIELFRQPALGGGTTVRATYDVSRDGRFLFMQGAPEVAAERARKLYPSSLRFILNWTDHVHRLLQTPQSSG
jgi:eukaryotic-like serine/threonine-protein kinase